MLHFFQRLPFEQGTPRTACGQYYYFVHMDSEKTIADKLEVGYDFLLHRVYEGPTQTVEVAENECQLDYEGEMFQKLSPEIQALLIKHYPKECLLRNIDIL